MHRKTSSLEGSVQLQEDYNKVLTAIEFMASSQAPSTSNTEEGCGIEQTVHDVDDEDECRLRKMIALCTIKAAACGVNLTAGSLADSVIRLGNGERAAAQELSLIHI